jgi:outer membrane protein assembly factor BamB
MKLEIIVLFLLLATGSIASDWPQFLGPNRDGTIADDTFVQGWVKKGIKAQWRVPVGQGYSGIAVQGNRLFTMDGDDRDEFLVALQSSDGKQLWRVRTGAARSDVYGGLGPRVTPSADRDLVFTVSAQGDLFAARAQDGQVVWKRALASDLGWRSPAEGTSCSPLIQDGRVYLIVGGNNGKAFAAFDRNTGKTIWTSQDDRTSYSSPIRWNFDGVEQALFLSGSNLFSLHADTGKLLWKYPWPTYDFVNVATPLILQPDRVFISAGYDQGAAMLRVQKNRDQSLQVVEVWRNREMKNHFNNSVYHSGVIYGFDNAILKAVDAQNGQTLWREKGFGAGSIVRAGDSLMILSDSGELVCAKRDGNALRILKRMQVLKGKSWTPPSLAQGRVFLRNHSEIVCLVSQ